MDPIVWPAPVVKFADAITVAEGSNPEWNNPGDLTYSMGFPIVRVVNADGVLQFVNKADGEHVLLHQCWLMLTGRSHIYKLWWTLETAGQEYSNGDKNWAVNVARKLGLPVTATLEQVGALS